MASRAQLVEALLGFPAPDRAEAARALLESLDDADDPIDVETAWRDEIASRVHPDRERRHRAGGWAHGHEPAQRARASSPGSPRLVSAGGYRLHPAATDELDAAGEWYDAQRPGLSLELLDAVEEAIALIVERSRGSATASLPGARSAAS